MTTLIEDIRPITRKSDAREIALSVYDDLISLVASLEGSEWSASTECPGWDVSDMVGHLIGMSEACASMREMVRQQVGGRLHASEYNGNPLDAMNARQIAKHSSLTPAE
ncbi:MAG: maleylpyruvate isomerase N-terminal domain-containing protein, partial [Nocardiaceae bacterium]|nr:maleylpyruvate isomerase N-terminal domain-containing protein [Nocardiaceae bacterium]